MSKSSPTAVPAHFFPKEETGRKPKQKDFQVWLASYAVDLMEEKIVLEIRSWLNTIMLWCDASKPLQKSHLDI